MNARRLLGYNLLSAVVLGLVGFYVGWWLGHQITGPSIAYFADTGQVVSDAQFTSWIAGERKQFTPVEKYLPPYALTYKPDPQGRAG